MADIFEIKRRTSCIDYAQRVLGLSVRVSGDRCKSLVPGSNNPTAMIIFNDWWYDHKMGAGGDVIDLCAVARHNGDRGAAIRELGGGNTGHWKEYTQNLNNGVAYWHEQLRESDMHYLYRRGIKKETVDRLMIGYDPKIGR